ncbi:MAG: NAD(P)H-dependent oxidoreductase [Oscillospiraceae bacterium]|nr:NAD(P)H-dependent oxidoreductase [Oscillospiraceae bacterium]
MQTLTILSCGRSDRLERLLAALPVLNGAGRIDADDIAHHDLRGRLLLFTVAVDALGEDAALCGLIRQLRATPDGLRGATAAVIVDGATELDTKDIARRLIFAANMAGCAFPGKPLVEATGSLQNLAVLQRKNSLPSLDETYRFAVSALLERLFAEKTAKKERPKLLVLHASDHETSNTLALGELVTRQLPDFEIKTISLRNGTIHDCRGCSYKVCSHFAAQSSCFYGGAMVDEVLPAVLAADALLLLCPNYNDAVGANITAFINRLTGLTVSNALYGRSLYAIVVSGYSGGDLVAQQLLGALCLNKALSLPPRFCLIKTANDPGTALKLPDIAAETQAFAAAMRETLKP